MKLADLVLLTEQVTRQDIIDAYLLMAMPSLTDKASQYLSQETIKRVRKSIIDELTDIILAEVGHVSRECKSVIVFSRALRDDKIEAIQLGQQLADTLFGKRIDFQTLATGLRRADELTKDENYQNQLRTVEDLRQITSLPWSMSAVKRAFSDLAWDTEYGGESWGEITAQTINLMNTSSNELFLAQFDRVVDFVHNTGTLLNKFRNDRRGGQSLGFVLDLKQEAIDPRTLARYASPEIAKLFRQGEWKRTQHLSQTPKDQEISALVNKMGKKKLDTNDSLYEFTLYLNHAITHYGARDLSIGIMNTLRSDVPQGQRVHTLLHLNICELRHWIRRLMIPKYLPELPDTVIRTVVNFLNNLPIRC